MRSTPILPNRPKTEKQEILKKLRKSIAYSKIKRTFAPQLRKQQASLAQLARARDL